MVTVKRYVVFAGDDYYPAGGWQDALSCHDDVEEALKAARGSISDDRWGRWWQVVDLAEGCVIADGCAVVSQYVGVAEPSPRLPMVGA